MIALVLTLLHPAAVVADTEFEGSIPVDLVKLFVGNPGYGETKIFSDVMDAFPQIEIPSGFDVLASMDRGYGLTVYLRTAVAEDSATEALTDALTAADFKAFEIPYDFGPDNGFVSAKAPARVRNSRYCNDSQGFISVSFAETGSMTTTTLSSSPSNDRRSCAEQLEEQLANFNSRAQRRDDSARQYLPRMELPEQEQRRSYTPFIGMSGSSNSRNGIEVSASLTSDSPIDEVFEHFESQIEAQGWTVDSQNVGTASAFGSWMRTPEPDLDLIGTLSIIQSSADTYDLKFNLVTPGRANNSNGTFFSN
ncbi:MAG: hypothetical protein ACI95C_002041 [Pseudohongiellaceae bacterium]